MYNLTHYIECKVIEADPGYLDRLRDLDDEVKRDMYLFGKWDTDLSGLFSNSYRRESNCLHEFDIPSTMKIRRCYDHGITAPWNVLYYVEVEDETLLIDDKERDFPRGTIIIINELHGGQLKKPEKALELTDYEIGQMIREYEDRVFPKKNVYAGPGDNASWNEDNNRYCPMDSILEGYFNRKVNNKHTLFQPYKKPSKSRIDGYARMRTMFKACRNYKDKFMEQAGLFVTDNCKQWLRCVPGAPRDPKRIEDCPIAYRDESLDCTRYIVLVNQPTVGMIQASVF